ncbi:conserved hypothetical protein [Streptomyces sviceus ATCC 29083]|uniref:Uncharacterized protein n=1 Tax=Streptomyces sviceus (strain ATCC 29083 / DSM 924 / JCM 4929 / NBRC 13980 / NCIMB 11184 / NRRL 5439 / UC 5370) TaxID=463191 RepID=B5HXI4_STRX2|nr:conserved hypothetical protein [Streptomyces sviceus ATCC 29083]
MEISNDVGARQRVTGLRFRMRTGMFPVCFIAVGFPDAHGPGGARALVRRGSVDQGEWGA